MTSIEWLEKQLADNINTIIIKNDYKLMEYILAEAKEMHKQEIIDAVNYENIRCHKIGNYTLALLGIEEIVFKTDDNIAEQYYNETFKKD